MRRIQEYGNKSERHVALQKKGREAGLLGLSVCEEPGLTVQVGARSRSMLRAGLYSVIRGGGQRGWWAW